MKNINISLVDQVVYSSTPFLLFLLLSSNLNLELAYDDKNKKGLNDEWYAKITLIHPPRTGPSLQDGFISGTAWKEEKDMSGELLTKVKRNNKIMIEFKGSSTISRTD